MTKFKKGDRVRHKTHGYTGRIKAVRDSATFKGKQDIRVGYGAWSIGEDFAPAPTKKDRKIARLEAELTALNSRMQSQIDSLNVIIDRNKAQREANEVAQIHSGFLPVDLLRTVIVDVNMRSDDNGGVKLEVVMVANDPHRKRIVNAIKTKLIGR